MSPPVTRFSSHKYIQFEYGFPSTHTATASSIAAYLSLFLLSMHSTIENYIAFLFTTIPSFQILRDVNNQDTIYSNISIPSILLPNLLSHVLYYVPSLTPASLTSLFLLNIVTVLMVFSFLMGYSRVITGMHSWVDVVSGGIMGIIMALIWWSAGVGAVMEQGIKYGTPLCKF